MDKESIVGKLRWGMLAIALILIVIPLANAAYKIYCEVSESRAESKQREAEVDQIEAVALPALRRVEISSLQVGNASPDPVIESYLWWIAGEGIDNLPDHRYSRKYDDGALLVPRSASERPFTHIYIVRLRRGAPETYSVGIYEDTSVAQGYENYERRENVRQEIVPLEADVFLFDVGTGEILGGKAFYITSRASYDGPSNPLPGSRPLGLSVEQIEYRILGDVYAWISGNYIDPEPSSHEYDEEIDYEDVVREADAPRP